MGRKQRPLRLARAWATAAVVVLGLALVISNGLQSPSRTDSPPAATPADAESRQVRSLDRALQPRLLSPSAGESVTPGELSFRWTSVPGTL